MIDDDAGPERTIRSFEFRPIKVGMSTAAVYPEGTAAAFALAAELGYDGVEVMVQTEALSQDADHWPI